MFKVGDEVIIRHDLDVRHGSEYLWVTPEMMILAGQKAVITNVSERDEYTVYDLDIDGGACGWEAQMLEMI